MQNNTVPHSSNNNTTSYPTIGFMEEKRIKLHIDAIAANSRYIVTDISPNARCVEHEYSGKYLKEHASEILLVLRHGCIVKSHGENGKNTIIFVYMGPIPRVVESILHSIH